MSGPWEAHTWPDGLLRDGPATPEETRFARLSAYESVLSDARRAIIRACRLAAEPALRRDTVALAQLAEELDHRVLEAMGSASGAPRAAATPARREAGGRCPRFAKPKGPMSD